MVNSNASIFETLREHRIIAIARHIPNSSADEIAEALYEGGIRLVEVTLNTPDALLIIARWRERFEGRMRVGAGTILDVKMAGAAVEAGAEFLISPHCEESVIAFGVQNGIATFPGALTPTEIVRAWQAGATAIKVFPSAIFGAAYFRELRGPLPQIPLVSVGGISAANLAEFLEAGAIGVGIGGNLVDLKLIGDGKFNEIKAIAETCVRAARGDAT